MHPTECLLYWDIWLFIQWCYVSLSTLYNCAYLGVSSSHGLIFKETFLPVGQGCPLLPLILQLCPGKLVAPEMFPNLLPHPRRHHHVHLLRAQPGADVRTPANRPVTFLLPDCLLAPLPSLQFLIESRFSIVATWRQRFSILWWSASCRFITSLLWIQYLVPIECKEWDWESESMQHLVFHSGEKNLQLLRLRWHRTWAEVGVARNWPE